MGAETTGVVGAGTMAMPVMPGVEEAPAALVTVQAKLMVPLGPGVKVMLFVLDPALIAPLVITQA